MPLAELRAYLFPEGRPQCDAVQELSVSRWAATYYDVVSTACVAVLPQLRMLRRAALLQASLLTLNDPNSGGCKSTDGRSTSLIDKVPLIGFGAAVEHLMAFLARARHLGRQLVLGASTAPAQIRFAAPDAPTADPGLFFHLKNPLAKCY